MKANRIVCPVDFSDSSQAALELASQLARESGGKLYLVHVDEEAELATAGLFGGVPPITLHTREELEQVAPAFDNVEFEHHLLVGDAVTQIINFADEVRADLIVMGTHGARGLARLVMGSVAEGVVRQARTPVLTLKRHSPLAEGEEANAAAAETPTEDSDATCS